MFVFVSVLFNETDAVKESKETTDHWLHRGASVQVEDRPMGN